MSLIGNILWIILGGGIVLAIEYLIAGLILVVTVIGIPFGLQSFKLAGLALLPFGKRIEPGEKANGAIATIMNILWLLAGIPIALTHLFFAIITAVTIIGIPFAKQHLKLAAIALSPFGKRVIG